jgi:multiple sugar transport system permease protein
MSENRILNVRWTHSETAGGWLMSLPALLGLILFIAFPFLLAIGLSFTNLRMGSPLPTRFIGFEAYHRVLTDPSFLRALMNNGLFALIVVPVQTVLALALALFLNQQFRGVTLFRTLFFMPVVFPLSLVSVVWILIYAPGANGMMNAFLDLISLGGIPPQDFLHNPYLALPAIMLCSIWQGVGFQMVILLAGLQSIPDVLYESAQIDRAGKWQQFIHVTLPQLRNPLVFTALVTTILAFRVFDQVEIMTRGGPNGASTTVMYEVVRTIFNRQQVGQASAMTVIFFILVLVITVVQRRFARQEREIK